MTQQITDENFENEVINSKTPVLVDFWADWCRPCLALAPVIDQISSEYANKLKVVKIDITDNPDNPSKYGVRNIPTLMIFKDGKLVSNKAGLHPKSTLEAWINQNI